MPALPLSTLLSQVVIAFTVELDNEFEHRFQQAGGGARVVSLTMWSNLLRFVGEQTTVGDLVDAVGLPKATVRSRIGGVERWRYVSVGPPAAKREGYGSARGLEDDWVVRLTPAGRAAAGIWPALPAEIEARWRERFGAEAIDELVTGLHEVDDGLGLDLPEYLPVVSSTHGMALELGRPERRQAADRSLVVLLAHALMAYTLDFEKVSPLALPLSANVVRVLHADGVPVRELPLLTGISKEAVEVSLTSLVRTDYVSVEGSPASKRTVRSTPAGARLRSKRQRDHARISKGWEARFGADVVRRVRSALEGILRDPALGSGMTPYPDGWRASKPYAERTRALLDDPTGALPHHPMVLHRGGWPDGS